MKAVGIIFLCFFLVCSSFGQTKCEQVLLKGKIEDSLNPQSFYNLMIVNRTKGSGYFGQPNGHFSVYVSNFDSICISVKGYPLVGFRVYADSNCQFICNRNIQRAAIELKETVIVPLKSLNQIREERENLSLRETRQVTGIEMLQSPITALYQTFSKKEKNKRWIAEQEFKDNERKVVQELLRLYVAYDIINLTDEEFDVFIDFLNMNELFLQTATELELISFVKDKFDHFKRVHSLTFEENEQWRTELVNANDKAAIVKLLDLYNLHGIIRFPKSEYDRFVQFSKLSGEYLKTATEQEMIAVFQEKCKKYIEFYKLNIEFMMHSFVLTEQDNYIWKAELNCPDNTKSAILELIKLYKEKRIINLPDSETPRLIQFLNLKEKFLRATPDRELITYVLEKQEKYIRFYKLK